MKTENPVMHATIAGFLAVGTAVATSGAWAVPDQPKNR